MAASTRRLSTVEQMREKRRAYGDGTLAGRARVATPVSDRRGTLTGFDGPAPDPTVPAAATNPRMILVTADTVALDPGWQPIAWDGVDATPGRLGYVWNDAEPAQVVADIGRVHLVRVALTWDGYQGGGSVRLLVNDEPRFGPDQDPQWTSDAGGQFAGTAVLRLAAGDVVTVEVNSGDVSAQTAAAVRMQVALPDPEGAGGSPTSPDPFWPFPNWPTFGYDDQEWLLAVGNEGGLVGNIRPTGPYVISLPLHPPRTDGLWLLAVGESGGLVGNIPPEA